MAHRYVKAPMYMGKSLAISTGRRQRTILDKEVLEGRQWEKYAKEGLLVLAPDEEAPKAPAPKPAPKPAPAPAPAKEPDPTPAPDPEPPVEVKSEKEPREDETKTETPPSASEGSVSKSPASKHKVPGARKGKGSKKSKK